MNSRTDNWRLLVLIYLYGVVSAASLSKAIPLQEHVIGLPGASPGSFALFISLMAVLPALLGTLSGAIIDRIGARPALIIAAVAGAVVNGLYYQANSMGSFMVIRTLEGAVPLCAYAAAPALMIAVATPERRSAAMSLWSTYTPVGTSLGLVLAASSATSAHWRTAYLLHGAIFLVMALLGLLLPRSAATPAAQRSSTLALLASREGIDPLRLALTFGVLIFLGLGVSVVYPHYLAQLHDMSLARAASILASANLTMIAGSMLSGLLLTRGMKQGTLFLGLAVAGSVAGIGAFAPWPWLSATLAALLLWQVCTGAAMAISASLLPRVVTPAHRAAAAGLLAQTGAILTFVTPPAWVPAVATGQWIVPALIIVGGWVLAAVLLPQPVSAPAAPAPR